MTEKISRRDFLKVAGTGAAITSILTGCGPAARYTTREPYTKMPEYTYNGQSTFYATSCRECPAGCGLVVRTMQGRAIKVEGNKLNPVNLGKTCARGQAALHGLYNPDRIQNPVKHNRGDQAFTDLEWDSAIQITAEILKGNPEETAFLLGLTSDHVFDLVSELCKSIGAAAPLQYGALGLFECRDTLAEASRSIFGKPDLLYYDLANADVTFSFGSGFLETWLSPVAYTRGFAKMRQGTNRRGYLVVFEPRMSQTAMKADEWIPVRPGSEGFVAAALGKLISETRNGSASPAFEKIDVEIAADLSGVSVETLTRLANIFNGALTPLAIPPGAGAAQSNGSEAVDAVLKLNVLVNNLGKPGGVFLTPESPLGAEYHPAANIHDLTQLVDSMNSGKIKNLFIHGVNPIFEIPTSLGFETAISKVTTVISFASYPDETALLSDYVFPDHTGLESFGYQRIQTGSNKSSISGLQPVVAPYYNTRSTVDLLLAAAAAAGGKAVLPYKDEVEFIQAKIENLVDARDGYYSASDMPSFWASFQQYGGWWQNATSLGIPAAQSALDQSIKLEPAVFEGEGEYILHTYVSPILGESGANKPWLQETPDPTTTVMWNTWLEINPKTAEDIGVTDDDVVRVVSPYGKIELSVLIYRAIRPEVVAIPFGQGHTGYGRYAENRGVNPADLFGNSVNTAHDLAYAGVKVKIEKTGKKRP
ncbi:MAG: molybdopterin-dependent oxidoreductase, partial [Chloroflexota bacterium]